MSQFCEHRNGKAYDDDRIVLIGLGANLPGPGGLPAIETCRQAVSRLNSLRHLRLIGLSRWFESAPVPPSGQPNYINAVALLRVDPGRSIDPTIVLSSLMEIEATCGRERSVPNAARTLDLDIIAIGGMVRTAPDPILPHPRAHLRAFVLLPLMDVAPNWVHPLFGKTAEELLADLPPQGVSVLG